ncbi:MAG: twin-arginine translocase TatA/TatE family subunit [bacterium]
MFGLGLPEIIIILLVVFLIFGARKLPEIGSGFGKAIKNFKNSFSGKDEIDVTPEDSKDEESKPKRKQIARSSSTPSSAKRKKQASAKTAKTTKKE